MTNEQIKQLADTGAVIRDEKGQGRNTAARVGNAIIEAATCLQEQQQALEGMNDTLLETDRQLKETAAATEAYIISPVVANNKPLIKYPELMTFNENTTQDQFNAFFQTYPFATLYDIAANGKKRLLAYGNNYYTDWGAGHPATRHEYVELKVLAATKDTSLMPAAKELKLQWELNGQLYTLSVKESSNRYQAKRTVGALAKEITDRLDTMDAKIGVIDTDLTNVLEG